MQCNATASMAFTSSSFLWTARQLAVFVWLPDCFKPSEQQWLVPVSASFCAKLLWISKKAGGFERQVGGRETGWRSVGKVPPAAVWLQPPSRSEPAWNLPGNLSFCPSVCFLLGDQGTTKVSLFVGTSFQRQNTNDPKFQKPMAMIILLMYSVDVDKVDVD